MDLAIISQTALTTKLRRADNQPLACVLTLHNTSDIYKVSISLTATRQQLAKFHHIDALDGTWCHQARAVSRPRAPIWIFSGKWGGEGLNRGITVLGVQSSWCIRPQPFLALFFRLEYPLCRVRTGAWGPDGPI